MANFTVPNGWSVRAGDQLPLIAPSQLPVPGAGLGLFLSAEQRKNKIKGKALFGQLNSVVVYGAEALEYFYNNQQAIPLEWQRQKPCFWGTIFRDAKGNRCVRYLYHCRGRATSRWLIDFLWLENYFFDDNPAVILLP